ncbi:hypothetical protein DFQ14_101595 [Halopolyspora algeriensis]|uniref:Uncharacterized protein n=1 Tax=Halopolyspora algeriensis TaxID=1500506 RepID=A0A368VZ13_9ACTN|nr:hypothetical protein DFQ14_101595 [Halopolyspora algeriensis]TQM42483.1 hypothetical protein FHU43_4113 [Halopolyspora algeriensis]
MYTAARLRLSRAEVLELLGDVTDIRAQVEFGEYDQSARAVLFGNVQLEYVDGAPETRSTVYPYLHLLPGPAVGSSQRTYGDAVGIGSKAWPYEAAVGRYGGESEDECSREEAVDRVRRAQPPQHRGGGEHPSTGDQGRRG